MEAARRETVVSKTLAEEALCSLADSLNIATILTLHFSISIPKVNM